MTLSIPGVIVSRDGTVRKYLGSSSRAGEVLGRTERHGGSWIADCSRATCRTAFGGRSQRECVYSMKDHWESQHRDTP